MATANYVLINGQYYAKGTKEAKAQQATARHLGKAGDGVAIQDAQRDFGTAATMRQTSLNKTEQRYFQILQMRFPNGYVQAHTIKLQLAEKCWYTPDFSYTLPTGALVFVETKGGFERDDAIVKLKTAARQFPQFTFIKAKYVKGKWTEQVMPK